MTSEPSQGRAPDTAYVWAWLPGAHAPVVAGSITQTTQRLGENPVIAFVYGRSYRERPDGISLFSPELPLRAGTFDPTRPTEASRAVEGVGQPWNGWPAAAQRSPQALAG